MNNNIAILLIILVIAGISIGLYYNKSKSSAPTIITTTPPRITTTPTLITTVPPRITTVPTLITSAPPRITTAPTIITTVPPLITTAPTRKLITVVPTTPPLSLLSGSWVSPNSGFSIYIEGTLVTFYINGRNMIYRGYLIHDDKNNLIVNTDLSNVNGFVTITSFNSTTLNLDNDGIKYVFTKR